MVKYKKPDKYKLFGELMLKSPITIRVPHIRLSNEYQKSR